MRVNICLLALVLGCKVTAEIIHKIIDEKASASLPCPHSVEGSVTWSRESDGNIVYILTAHGDGDIRYNDPGKRYGSLADKSLFIRRVNVSDSGRYLCNNEAAVELTVIPKGTIIQTATERTNVDLTCPHDVGGSGIATWSRRDTDDVQQKKGFYVSFIDNSLSISGVELGDSGLYYCDGKPAVYLNVIKGDKTPPRITAATRTTGQIAAATTSTPTTMMGAATTANMETTITQTQSRKNKGKGKKKPKRDKNGNDQDNMKTTPKAQTTPTAPKTLTTRPTLTTATAGTTTTGNEERCPVYDEIQEGLVIQRTDGGGSLNGQTTTYCMAEFPNQSNQHDPTYSTIADLLPEEETKSFLHNEPAYALIGNTFIGGNNKGSFPHDPQQTDNTYFLLEKPKATENNNDQSIV